MTERFQYRNQANEELVVVSGDNTFVSRLMSTMRKQNIFVQMLSPNGPTAPTINKNAERTTTAVIGPDVFRNTPQIVERVIDECRAAGVLNIVLAHAGISASELPGLPVSVDDDVLENQSVIAEPVPSVS